MQTHIVLAAAALAAFSSVASAATVINVDFNNSNGSSPTYSGQGVVVDTGNNLWNGFTVGNGAVAGPTTSASLLTSTGSASGGVTVTLSNYQAYADGMTAGIAANLMTNFVYQPGGTGPGGSPGNFSINGLNPAFTYDLYLYSQNAGYSETISIFNIGAASRTATNTPGASSFTLNGNYVLFSGVAPNGSGVISGTFNDVKAADNAAFNGMQIVVAVPEPSTLLPLAGLAGLLLRRRRS